MDQIPITMDSFGTNDFAENPEPRVPCILLLDVSQSMRGEPIRELNAGLVSYKDEVSADALALKRVEVCVVTFGGVVEERVAFTTPAGFTPPALDASGDTPMGSAIDQAIDLIDKRKAEYKANGIAYFRPWIFMVTDGGPTDEWRTAAARVKEGESKKAFAFFGVGVEGANMDVLSQICVREPLKLQGLRFRDLFKWLSTSQASVSRSAPGDDVALTNPTGPTGWASV